MLFHLSTVQKLRSVSHIVYTHFLMDIRVRRPSRAVLRLSLHKFYFGADRRGGLSSRRVARNNRALFIGIKKERKKPWPQKYKEQYLFCVKQR